MILVVNVASRCGFTPQYSALESIYEKYKDQGFVIWVSLRIILAVRNRARIRKSKPSARPSTASPFPIYSKVSVKGPDQTPLYQYLTTTANPALAGDIKWNFTKFLVSRDGQVVKRFDCVTPDSSEVTSAIEAQLKEK